MNIQQFLENHHLLPEAFDVAGLVQDFLSEMEKGLAGKESSLAMIPSYITAGADFFPGERVAVIDAGGTNLRVAGAFVDDRKKIRIDFYEKFPMPGSRGEVSADQFFGQLAGHVRPVLEKTDRIGFCFSYPAEITPDKDGRLIKWTKEMKAPQVIGQLVGRGLLEALGSAGAGKRIVLLNDTIATLLAGKSVAGERRFESFIGFILGTGTNIAYLERNGNLTKVGGLDPSGFQAVNVESADFSKTFRGDIDMLLDSRTGDPGGHPFEKMISGRYLPEIILLSLQQACREGVFGGVCAAWIEGLERLDHDVMDALATEADVPVLARLSQWARQSMGAIVKNIIQRAAKLAAINITAAAVKAVGADCKGSVCINIDGSTYYKVAGLRGHTEAYLGRMLGARGISYELVHVGRSPLIGAAIAGLVN
jgi:hexokinase